MDSDIKDRSIKITNKYQSQSVYKRRVTITMKTSSGLAFEFATTTNQEILDLDKWLTKL